MTGPAAAASRKYRNTFASTARVTRFSGAGFGRRRSDSTFTGTARAPRMIGTSAATRRVSTASPAHRSARMTFTSVSPSVIMRSFGCSFFSVAGLILGGMGAFYRPGQAQALGAGRTAGCLRACRAEC